MIHHHHHSRRRGLPWLLRSPPGSCLCSLLPCHSSTQLDLLRQGNLLIVVITFKRNGENAGGGYSAIELDLLCQGGRHLIMVVLLTIVIIARWWKSTKEQWSSDLAVWEKVEPRVRESSSSFPVLTGWSWWLWLLWSWWWRRWDPRVPAYPSLFPVRHDNTVWWWWVMAIST